MGLFTEEEIEVFKKWQKENSLMSYICFSALTIFIILIIIFWISIIF